MNGVIMYFFAYIIVTLCILVKSDFRLKNYFFNDNVVYFSGISNDLLLYLMVWVIFHTIVNIL
jgi:hypothetical protein